MVVLACTPPILANQAHEEIDCAVPESAPLYRKHDPYQTHKAQQSRALGLKGMWKCVELSYVTYKNAIHKDCGPVWRSLSRLSGHCADRRSALLAPVIVFRLFQVLFRFGKST